MILFLDDLIHSTNCANLDYVNMMCLIQCVLPNVVVIPVGIYGIKLYLLTAASQLIFAIQAQS